MLVNTLTNEHCKVLPKHLYSLSIYLHQSHLSCGFQDESVQ